jgi:autotransporter adhesin
VALAALTIGTMGQSFAFTDGGGTIGTNGSANDIAIGTDSYAYSNPGSYTNPAPRPDGSATSVVANSSTAMGQDATASGQGSTAIGSFALANANHTTALGDMATASGQSSVALGVGSLASGRSAVAIGAVSVASGSKAVAIGSSAWGNGAQSVALGAYSNAAADNSLALGTSASATNANDVALGANSVTAAVVNTTGTTIGGTTYSFAGSNATSTVSVGAVGAERTITNVAAGQISSTSTDAVNGSQLYATNQAVDSVASSMNDLSKAAVKYDTNADGSVNFNSITMGGTPYDASTHTDGTQIHNVADGTQAGDAVNYSQLSDVSSQVTNDTNADGSVNYNSITMGGSTYDASTHTGGTQIHNVADGTQAGDAVNYAQVTDMIGNITNIAESAANPFFAVDGNRDTDSAVASGTSSTASGARSKATGAKSTAIGADSTASADNSVALGAGSVADRDNTVSIGSAGHERTITNVANGTQATDAANVGQMNDAINKAVGDLPAGVSAKDYTDQRFGAMQNTVNQVAKNAYAGVAAAMAMPNMTPSHPGNTVVAAGAGMYKSGAAVGVGATYRSRDDKWLDNGAVSVTSTGDAGVRLQLGREF